MRRSLGVDASRCGQWGWLEATASTRLLLTPSSEEDMGAREGMTGGVIPSVRGVRAVGWVGLPRAVDGPGP